jgi:tetratricopeptide (TPR) repeat protein
LRDKAIARLTKPVLYRHKERRGLARLLPPLDPGWVSRTIESYGLLSAAYGFHGQPVKGLEIMQRALQLLPFTDTPLEGALLVASCSSLLPASRYDELVQITARARSLLLDRDLTGLPALQAAQVGSSGYHNAISYQGFRPDETFHEDALSASNRIHAFNLMNVVWTFPGIWYAWTGRSEEALRVIDRITQNSRKIGAPPYNWVLYLRPLLAWQKGEFEEAKALVQHALRYPHLDREAIAEQCLHVLKGLIHLSLKELDEAQAAFESVERRGRSGQMALVTMQALIGKGQLAKVQGDWAAARRHLDEAYEMAADGPARNPFHQAIAGRLLGEVALAEKDYDKAKRCFESAWEIVARPEQDNLIEQGHLLRALGELSLASGEREAAKEAFQKAADIFAGLQNRYLLRFVTQHLEALEGSQPIAKLIQAEPEPVPLASLTSGWQLKVTPSPHSSEELYQAILTCCETDLRATEASIFLCEPGITWVASRSHGSPSQQLPVNEALISRALAEKEGLVAFDVPAELEIGAGTNMEMEVSSVLLSPIRANGDVRALLYLVNRDLSEPYFEEDLEALSALALVTESAMAQLPTA